jgi:hypothetical protein
MNAVNARASATIEPVKIPINARVAPTNATNALTTTARSATNALIMTA